MRYIPDTGKQFILQVPEDKNSYLNVKNFNARGVGDVFSGRLQTISETGLEFSVTGAESEELFNFAKYRDILTPGIDLYAFVYRPVSITTPPASGLITINSVGTVAQGIDYSGQNISGSGTFLAPLTYYIFAYNVITGELLSGVTKLGGSPSQYTKVLDPTKWNKDQYFKISIGRPSKNILPIIYRKWGSTLDFLGVIGNDKIGYNNSNAEFIDYGDSEIPSWNRDESFITPSFLEGVFTTLNSEPLVANRIIGKEVLKIDPSPVGTYSENLSTSNRVDAPLTNNGKYQQQDTIKFIIDDSAPISQAINLAADGGIKEIFFPGGVYNISNLSFITNNNKDYSNISFRGVGEASVIKRLPSINNSPILPGLLHFSTDGINNVNGIRFMAITFDGNRSSNFSLNASQESAVDPTKYTAENLLFIKNSNNSSISECVFLDSGSAAVHIEDAFGFIVSNSVFNRIGRSYETAASPLEAYDAEGLIVQANIFRFCTDGPFFSSTNYSTINNNIVRSCGDNGIVLDSSSEQWNAITNIAYSDTDSLIRSVDQYNNEYSAVSIEVKRGFALSPMYFTVTDGGESVSIQQDSIVAKIFELNSNYEKAAQVGYFQVIQTLDQLNAGIFSVSLPGVTNISAPIGTILATSGLSLPDPLNNKFGYYYEISADVLLGGSGRGFTPLSLSPKSVNGINYTAVKLKNSSDLLSFNSFGASSTENDEIIFLDLPSGSGLQENFRYTVSSIDASTNSLLIPVNSSQSLTLSGGRVYVIRKNYHIASGNLLVH